MDESPQKTKAVAYYRTSSATNVGDDKDSKKRQQGAVMDYAAKNGIEIVGEYYDAAVKGSDPVTERPGFRDMLDYISGNGARTILIETANRFARDVVVQITAYEYLKKNGINIIPVDSPTHFLEDTPSAEMIRGIFAVVSQFEKSSLVEKLKKARDRKRRESGRCEGRKPAPDKVRVMAIEMSARGLSLRQIGAKLAEAGHFVLTPDPVTGERVSSMKPYGPQSIKCMLSVRFK